MIYLSKADIKKSREYKTIRLFYAYNVANRSGVPLMNHIDEGLVILNVIGASYAAKLAFCIHPIIQGNLNIKCTENEYVLSLANEYKVKANSYLCKPETDHIQTIEQMRLLVGEMSKDCADMLMADKMQNKKDFIIYHQHSHPRSPQLEKYFDLWIEYLEKLEN